MTKKLTQSAKIGIAIGGVVCLGALATGITYLYLHQNDATG